MKTKSNRIACDVCRKFISLKSLEAGRATHVLLTPDSEFTKETFESICEKCLRKDKEAA
jgi:hypothetical protein